jgi:hypothetical protein
MARAKPAELPGSMAVLGLVIERPDQTVSYYGQALESRFARARWAASFVHSTLPQMARGRQVRVQRTFAAPGKDRSSDRYAPTELGRELHCVWMHALPSALPPIRDGIYGRLEFAKPEQLPLLIQMAYEEVRIASELFAETTALLRKHEIKRERPKRTNPETDVVRGMRETALYVDPLIWSSRASVYELIAEHLEETAKKAGIRVEPSGLPRIRGDELDDVRAAG